MVPALPEVRSRRVDLVGMWASGLCLVHCLATPVLLSVSAASFGHQYALLDYSFLVFAIVAGVSATRRALPAVRALLVVGMGLFALSFGLHVHEGLLQYAHVPGSLLLILGHWLNLRRRGCTIR